MFGLPRILAVLLAIYGTLFTLHSLTIGRPFPPDSMNYVDVARNIGAGRGIVQTTIGFNRYHVDPRAESPVPFVSQPPLYPLAIAGVTAAGARAGVRSGMTEENAALLIAAVSYVAVLLLSFLLARHLAGDAAGAFALGIVAIHYPLAEVSRHALSDTPGLAFALLSLLFVAGGSGISFRQARDENEADDAHGTHSTHGPHGPHGTHGTHLPVALFLGGLAAGSAFATRYALAPVAIAGLFVLVRRSPRSIPGLLALVSGVCIPAAVVLGRNAVLAGAPMPEVGPSRVGLFENAWRFLLALVPWLADPARVSLFAQSLVIFVSVALAVRFLRKRARTGGSGCPVNAGAVALLGTTILFYAIFLVAQRTRLHFDEIGPRLALPASISLVLLLAIVFVQRAAITRKAGIKLGAGFLVLAIGGQAALMVQSSHQPPVSPERWEQINWLKEHSNGGDWIVGEDVVDIPFLLLRERVISFSEHPYTEIMTYERLLAIRDAKWSDEGDMYLMLREHPELDEEEWRERYGDFVADLAHGEEKGYEEVGRPTGTPKPPPGIFLVQPKRTTR